MIISTLVYADANDADDDDDASILTSVNMVISSLKAPLHNLSLDNVLTTEFRTLYDS